MRKERIEFTSCPKTFTEDQDKAISPQKTLEIFYSKIQSLNLKILNEVKRIDNGRLGIPVYFSVCGEDATELTGTKKQMGKGASPVQAEASACMELAERFSFFAFKENRANFLAGDYKSMKAQGYPVPELSLLLASVHDTHTSEELFEQLLSDIPMLWTWGTNITRNEQVLVPFSWFFAINEFNGPSAGNTLEEAALQGISEIVERHVCSVVSHDQMETRVIDPATVDDPVALELLNKFKQNGINLYLNDFSLDTGIPTVAALAYDPSTLSETSEIVFTAGTTPDPQKALIRAVTEVAQLAGDFNTGSNYIASGLPKPLDLQDVAYLLNSPEKIAVQDMADLAAPDIKDEIDNCIHALKEIDLEILMIDVTHQGLAIPALYTIVPGAHFRERSRINDVGLFAAKLAVELVSDTGMLDSKLGSMEQLLGEMYYLAFYRGKNFYNLGLLEEAVGQFKTALDNRPEQEDLPYIYSFLGSCLKEIGRYKEAIETLQKGLAEDEERPDIHNSLGVCYFKLEQFETAILHLQRAVELNPASAIDYANLGVNYHKVGRNEPAIEALTVALTLDPGLEFAENLLRKISTSH